jgi:hypothetical protein
MYLQFPLKKWYLDMEDATAGVESEEARLFNTASSLPGVTKRALAFVAVVEIRRGWPRCEAEWDVLGAWAVAAEAALSGCEGRSCGMRKVAAPMAPGPAQAGVACTLLEHALK